MADYTIDTWSALSHKLGLKAGSTASGWSAPSWVGEPNRRRLAAYKILAAYVNNVARLFLDVPDDKKDDRREYGDPATLVAALLGATMGDEQAITVEGAGDDVPLEDDGGQDPGADGPAERVPNRIEAARIQAAQDREEWFQEWAKKEHPIRKINETEGKASALGDGVYRFMWSSAKKRVLMRIYDPGFYFPVFSDDEEDEFPRTIHLAWEYDERDATTGETVRWVRRITYRLAPIDQQAVDIAPPVEQVSTMTGIHTWVEERDQTEPRVVRKLPYQDEPTAITCYLSDGKWKLSDIEQHTVADLMDANATWILNSEDQPVHNLDLLIDFIPIGHLPNTSSEEEHFGRSDLLNVAQIFDDIAAADTDLSKAAGTTGFPPIVLRGADAGTMTYGPGKIIQVNGENAGLDVIDTSASLDALLKYVDKLLERLSTNSRVPAAVLGRIDPAKIASGVLLALSFGPLHQVTKEKHLVRNEKYPLFLKMVQRLAIVGGILDAPVLEASLKFGSFLPSDKQAMVTMVRAMLGAGTEPALISRQTALAMLIEVGFDIDDAADELDRIEREDFAGASRLLDATGDEAAVFEYLHRQPPEPAAPAPGAPGAPGGVPQLDDQGNPIVTPPPGDPNAPPRIPPPPPPPAVPPN